MSSITVNVGEELFIFSSFNEWCDTARRKFKQAKRDSRSTLCVDAWGRICTSGKEFMRAQDDRAYPVRVYALD